MKKGRTFGWRASFLLGVMMLAFLTGCSRKVEKVEVPAAEQKIRVGFSMGTLMQDRWIRDRSIFMAKAKQEGIDVIVKNANNDSAMQYNQVLDMLNQGIDVLVIAPNDSFTEKRCVKAAKDKHVPVISYDRLIADGDSDIYLSFNHRKVGELMAEYLLKQAPQGGYLIVNGSKSDYNSTLINEGVMTVLKPHIQSGKIQIIAEKWVDGWIRETAYQFATEEIRKNSDKISAIICANDSLAWGVIDALSEGKIANKVKVSGQDADLVACQRIVSGIQTMTVYKPIKKLVEKTVEVCLKLARGEKIQYDGTISDGTYQVPYIYIDVEAVTQENMDETVIKDGFHLKEDVYQTKK